MVATGGVLLLDLRGRWRDMMRMGHSLFRSGWPGGSPAGTAVIADVVHRDVVDYGSVINVM